jgi:hypothetical protein
MAARRRGTILSIIGGFLVEVLRIASAHVLIEWSTSAIKQPGARRVIAEAALFFATHPFVAAGAVTVLAIALVFFFTRNGGDTPSHGSPSPPPAVSQNMAGSSGGIQAGRDVNIGLPRDMTPEPDVVLELSARRETQTSLEPVEIIAFNDSSEATAMDVEIGPLSSGNYPSGAFTGDVATLPGLTFVSTTVCFDPISHLEGKQRAARLPILTSRSLVEGGLIRNGKALDLWWFIDAALRHREHEELSKLTSTSNSERETLAAKLRLAPIDIQMRVTYRDSRQVRRWERTETLRYDPGTRTARIFKHGERRELIDTAPDVRQPIAAVELICDSTHAEIVIRNDGPIADFWGTLRIIGDVESFWDMEDLFCRWKLTPSVRMRIAKGDECRIVLAVQDRNLNAGLVGPTAQWVIYAIAGTQMVQIRGRYCASYEYRAEQKIPDIVLKGSIIADPDLANGIQYFRVTLKPFEAVCE